MVLGGGGKCDHSDDTEPFRRRFRPYDFQSIQPKFSDLDPRSFQSNKYGDDSERYDGQDEGDQQDLTRFGRSLTVLPNLTHRVRTQE